MIFLMAHLAQLAQFLDNPDTPDRFATPVNSRSSKSAKCANCVTQFFIGAILDFLYHPMLLPLIAPTEGRTTAYTLSLGFGNEELGLEVTIH